MIENSEVSDGVRDRLGAALLAEQGRTQDAIARLESAAAAHPSVEIYADLARLLLSTGDARRAVEAIDAGLELEPGSSELAALSASARMRAVKRAQQKNQFSVGDIYIY